MEKIVDKIKICIQCGTCSSSCPLNFAMDIPMRKLIGLIKAGYIKEVLKSKTFWLCLSCYFCKIRCPKNIDLPEVMYNLHEICLKENILPENKVQWPCKTKLDPGCEYLHKDGFTRGKGRFIPVQEKEPFEVPDKEFPFILTTGRIIFHYHTATMTKNSPTLNKELSNVYMEINPEDAKRLSIEDGEKVKVISRRGEIEIKVRITDNVPPGLVYIPMHFSESPVNLLTSHEPLDPQSKIPPYKYSCVNIKKLF
jgi:predicted molibdopterin-dependent oxidoreductase YjgC